MSEIKEAVSDALATILSTKDTFHRAFLFSYSTAFTDHDPQNVLI